MIKIAVIIDYRISAGGGFVQALNAIIQLNSIAKGKYDVVIFTNNSENLRELSQLSFKVKFFRLKIIDKIIAYGMQSKLLRLFLGKFEAFGLNTIGPFELLLMKEYVDIVYFVNPSINCLVLQKLNYIITVWDIGHRDILEFPEAGRLSSREALYKKILHLAFLIIVDSDRTAKCLLTLYGIEANRQLIMPFSPNIFIENQSELYKDISSKESTLEKYQLEEGYYFYPAQFWAHKNHIRIIQALALLKNAGIERNVVFSGSDFNGQEKYVRSVAKKIGVFQQIKFLGFVPNHDLRGLYEGCVAVVMPTYLGPTNLPPLEAWILDKPLIYSLQCAEQAGDAALIVDPDDVESLASAMKEVLSQLVAKELIKRGRCRLEYFEQQRISAEVQLCKILERFEKRRECWGRY